MTYKEQWQSIREEAITRVFPYQWHRQYHWQWLIVKAFAYQDHLVIQWQKVLACQFSLIAPKSLVIHGNVWKGPWQTYEHSISSSISPGLLSCHCWDRHSSIEHVLVGTFSRWPYLLKYTMVNRRTRSINSQVILQVDGPWLVVHSGQWYCSIRSHSLASRPRQWAWYQASQASHRIHTLLVELADCDEQYRHFSVLLSIVVERSRFHRKDVLMSLNLEISLLHNNNDMLLLHT